MTPTIYGGAESLLAQSVEHLRARKPFTGCNAGHTFFHSDPHGLVSICKVGRDDQIDGCAGRWPSSSRRRRPRSPTTAKHADSNRRTA